MLTRHLVADTKTIEQLRKKFKLLDKDVINWTEIYVDIATDDQWLYYRVDTYLQGGGYPIFAKQPLLDTKQLIQLSITSLNDDEVFAACRTLVDNEATKKFEFRADLINELERIDDKQRQQKIISLTGLDNPLNRRETVGKSFEEINNDSNFYRDIAKRAERLNQ
jgi:hypothetical protein